MSYRIERSERSGESVRRIALEQIDLAVDEIEDSGLRSHETVHQVRKRCKKIRGLLRLVRKRAKATYEAGNRHFRDAARELSRLRDGQSMIETVDHLEERFGDTLEDGALRGVRRRLVEQRDALSEELRIDERLERFHDAMAEARRSVPEWDLPENDEFGAFAGGLAKTYRRARRGRERCLDSPSVENFHEWRKRIKYHWYHTRLLEPVWTGELEVRAEETHELANLLGDDHDLAVLREELESWSDGSLPLAPVVGLANQRQVELRSAAQSLGIRVTAEEPEALVERIGTYWRAWRSEEDQPLHRPELITD